MNLMEFHEQQLSNTLLRLGFSYKGVDKYRLGNPIVWGKGNESTRVYARISYTKNINEVKVYVENESRCFSHTFVLSEEWYTDLKLSLDKISKEFKAYFIDWVNHQHQYILSFALDLDKLE